MDYQEKDNAIVPPDGNGEFFAAYGTKHVLRLREGVEVPFTPPTLEVAADILALIDAMDDRDNLPRATEAHDQLLRGFRQWFRIPADVAIYPLEVFQIVRRFFGFSRLQTPGRPAAGESAHAAAPTANAGTASPTPSPTSPAPITTSRTRRSRGRVSSSSSAASTGSAPRSSS